MLVMIAEAEWGRGPLNIIKQDYLGLSFRHEPMEYICSQSDQIKRSFQDWYHTGQCATTLRIMKFSIMTFSIMTLSIMTCSTTLN
jgi:hypothetical protein